MLGGGEVAVQGGVLGHEADLDEQPGVAGWLVEHPDAAGGGRQQPDGQVQQGGLAGAVGADQGGDAAPGDGQVALLQGPGAPVALAEPAGLQGRAHAMPSWNDDRSVVSTRATTSSWPIPAACARPSQASSSRRSAAWLASAAARLHPKVPSPGRLDQPLLSSLRPSGQCWV